MASRNSFCLTVLLVSLGAFGPAAAHAQGHELPFAQAGAALEYADAEARILHAAVTAKQFDLGFTKQVLEELEKALAEAKRSVDRAETLLPDNLAKMSEKLLELRDKVVAAETQRERLATLIADETKVLLAEDEEEAAELPPTDWKLLEGQAAWLAVDVDAASAAHSQIARALKAPMPKAVRRPKGKREAN